MCDWRTSAGLPAVYGHLPGHIRYKDHFLIRSGYRFLSGFQSLQKLRKNPGAPGFEHNRRPVRLNQNNILPYHGIPVS